jgi:UDP-N-acetylglucosamine 1-carboxyvinyltransferase
MALEKMGASIHESQGYVDVRAPKGGLLGALIEFPKISVGATENALMAACLANGTTVLKNAAQEPEILGLAEALKSMGAKIEGVGTSTIKIEGTSTLLPMNFSIPPDRIEVATYLIAAAMTGGTVSVDGVNLPDLEVILKSLELAGTTVSRETQSVTVKSSGRLCPVNIQTAPFPGFPTDVQAQWVALMTQADGETLIHETIFENRFMHVAELVRLGADIRVEGSLLKIRGTPGRLEGAPVMATDLRASASLVLAGLVAKGQTRVKRIYHLDRGYESMEVKLRSLGAQVERSLDS